MAKKQKKEKKAPTQWSIPRIRRTQNTQKVLKSNTFKKRTMHKRRHRPIQDFRFLPLEIVQALNTRASDKPFQIQLIKIRL
jgi:hypothetical protein